MNKISHLRYWLLFIVFLSGCTALAVKQFDELYGPAQTQERIVATASEQGAFYSQHIKPILDNRCVVCHGCFDAPCQLKLSSPAGIDRGLSSLQVYTRRFSEAEPTRLFEDADTTQAWPLKGFQPVLNERYQTDDINLQAGLLYQLLELKKNAPQAEDAILTADYDFSLSRSEVCPTIEVFDSFAKSHPNWGMPYGLPALSDDEFNKMETWLANGAKMVDLSPLNKQQVANIEQIEQFLNQSSHKHRLMSRYIYEHLFVTHLYFSDDPQQTFFTLIRSKTPPGQAVERIITRRPYDDPDVDRVYYRVIPEPATILEKTHIPYKVDASRLQRWQDLFLNDDYQVVNLPGYDVKVAANPFVTFHDIPVHIRNKFLLDDAQVFIMGFIKGSVCHGDLALNVINDRFWVVFVDPLKFSNEGQATFLAEQIDNLRLPSEESSTASIFSWRKYAKQQKNYFKAKNIAINNVVKEDVASVDLSTIWDGNQTNPNAALTAFRHYDNATVVQGLVGENPKTAWVIDYALFERIHYLLVAGFDVFGDISHQVMTRMYMDFLRIEGEFNFISFLPPEDRYKEMTYWYRGADKSIDKYIHEMADHAFFPSNVAYQGNDHKAELYDYIKQHLMPVLDNKHEINNDNISQDEARLLKQLAAMSGEKLAILPEVIFMRLNSEQGEEQFYTIVNNRAYANVTSLLDDTKNRLPKEDTLTIVPGFLGSYPNVFWNVDSADLADLVQRVDSLSSEADYRGLLDRYAIRRTSNAFWQFSDHIHDQFQQLEPINSGLFDYNRLENR